MDFKEFLIERIDITSVYSELKKIVRKGEGNWDKFINSFDKQAGEYDKEDIYSIRDALSSALDSSGTSFSSPGLTKLLVKKFGK